MQPFALILVLISAVFHAGWNIMTRGQQSKTAFLARVLASVAIIGFIPFVTSEIITRSLPSIVWLYVALSGLCCGFYFYSLSRAYSAADFTIVYPLARAMPVLLIGLGDVMRGRAITAGGWLGMILVASGCVLAPLHSFREIRLHRYLNKGNFWVLLAAAGTVGFTMFDKVSSELVSTGPASAARYGYFLYFFSFITFALSMRLFGGDHKDFSVHNTKPVWPIIGGLFTFGGYWLILWAFQMSEHASYVNSFRQFSIVLGVIFAFTVFKEKGLAVRLPGTMLIAAGLVILRLYG